MNNLHPVPNIVESGRELGAADGEEFCTENRRASLNSTGCTRPNLCKSTAVASKIAVRSVNERHARKP